MEVMFVKRDLTLQDAHIVDAGMWCRYLRVWLGPQANFSALRGFMIRASVQIYLTTTMTGSAGALLCGRLLDIRLYRRYIQEQALDRLTLCRVHHPTVRLFTM